MYYYSNLLTKKCFSRYPTPSSCALIRFYRIPFFTVSQLSVRWFAQEGWRLHNYWSDIFATHVFTQGVKNELRARTLVQAVLAVTNHPGSLLRILTNQNERFHTPHWNFLTSKNRRFHKKRHVIQLKEAPPAKGWRSFWSNIITKSCFSRYATAYLPGGPIRAGGGRFRNQHMPTITPGWAVQVFNQSEMSAWFFFI